MVKAEGYKHPADPLWWKKMDFWKVFFLNCRHVIRNPYNSCCNCPQVSQSQKLSFELICTMAEQIKRMADEPKTQRAEDQKAPQKSTKDKKAQQKTKQAKTCKESDSPTSDASKQEVRLSYSYMLHSTLENVNQNVK